MRLVMLELCLWVLLREREGALPGQPSRAVRVLLVGVVEAKRVLRS